MKDVKIKLNFLPFENQDITFKVYRQDYSEQNKQDGYFRKQLPIVPGTDEYAQYWVTFNKTDGFDEFECKGTDNAYLTLAYIWNVLQAQIRNKLIETEYIFPEKSAFKRYASIIIGKHELGDEVIKVEPYFLKSHNKFGILIDFRFKKKENIPFTKKIQQLSLSLDKNFNGNSNYYSDKYDKISYFLKQFGKRLFPINITGTDHDIQYLLYSLKPDYLKPKTYVFANNKANSAQFNGVKEYGPLKQLEKEPLFVFIFQESQKDLANDVYKTLTGAMFPNVFSGMKKMFGVDMTKENVTKINIQSYNKSDLEQIDVELVRIMQNNPDKLIIGLFIEHAREFTSGNAVSPYYYLKYLFTKNHLPLQAITIEGIRGKNGLKWHASGIGLQLFAKMGGIPWKVRPSNDNCLIFGLGSAHKEDDNGEIKRYFAYSVCLDSSGIYKKLDILGEGDSEDTYIAKLKENIKSVLQSSVDSNITKCAIHLPFKIKMKELQSIKDGINDFRASDNKIEFVFVKINIDNKYFGYAENNSKVPYEGSSLKLSKNEYLVWFEGLQFGKEIVSRRISGPVHIEFINDELEEEKRQKYLQDIINLSGANWRGFNAKLSPISIFYPEIIAKYLAEFRAFCGDKEVDISNIQVPWFL